MGNRLSGTWNDPRVRRVVRYGGLAALLVLLAWGWTASYSWNRQVERGTEAVRVAQIVRVLQADLELRREILRGDPMEAREPSPAPESELERRAQPIRRFCADHPPAIAALEEAERHRREAIEQTRALFLRRVERGASEATGHDEGAALHAIEQELSAAARRLTVVEQTGQHSVERALHAARAGNRLLLFGIAAVLLLLWRFYRADQQRRRHMEGARLVEEMLEAYSRRLESMNVQLEQLNLLKTQFLANTSHELLTPLNGVMGSLEVIRSGSCGLEEDREFVEQAYHSAEKLHGLIRDLLDLCRLEEGDFALRLRPVDFGPALERELARHRVALNARDLVLLVTPPAGGWPGVKADPERLRQILFHVLANALKFTERGSIRVTGRLIEEDGLRLRVEVTDTGVGIAPERLPQVFELFSQGDNSSTRRFGGTGLGLTLTRHLVHGMGGRIGIESDGPGHGTRVWFTLRLASTDADANVASRAA